MHPNYPQYSADPCNVTTCYHNGTCHPNGTMPWNAWCNCTTGFSGTNCEIVDAIDICLTDPWTSINLNTGPCMNNGTCTSTFDSYICNCTDTFFNGTNCTTPSLLLRMLR